MATPNIDPIDDGRYGCLEDGQHQGSVVRSAFLPRCLLRITREQRAQFNFNTPTKDKRKDTSLRWTFTFWSGTTSLLSFGDDNFDSLHSENFSLNKMVSLCSVSLPNMAQSGRPWPFLFKTVQIRLVLNIQGREVKRKAALSTWV